MKNQLCHKQVLLKRLPGTLFFEPGIPGLECRFHSSIAYSVSTADNPDRISDPAVLTSILLPFPALATEGSSSALPRARGGAAGGPVPVLAGG